MVTAWTGVCSGGRLVGPGPYPRGLTLSSETQVGTELNLQDTQLVPGNWAGLWGKPHV